MSFTIYPQDYETNSLPGFGARREDPCKGKTGCKRCICEMGDRASCCEIGACPCDRGGGYVSGEFLGDNMELVTWLVTGVALWAVYRLWKYGKLF